MLKVKNTEQNIDMIASIITETIGVECLKVLSEIMLNEANKALKYYAEVKKNMPYIVIGNSDENAIIDKVLCMAITMALPGMSLAFHGMIQGDYAYREIAKDAHWFHMLYETIRKFDLEEVA